MSEGDLTLQIVADLKENINEKLAKIEKGIANIGDTTRKFGSSISDMPKKLGENASNASIKLKKLQSQMNDLAKTSRNVFLGLAAGAGLAVKKYAEFESGILKVQTISNKSFNDIKKSAEDLSLKYGISVSQITEGNYQLVSSMGDVAESQSILETTAKLSIAGFTDYTSAMNGLVSIMNGYKMEAKEAGKVADILMTIQNKGVTTINELQASLSRVTSIASNVNVSFEDLAAAMATITANKVETAEAVTSLRAAFSELAQTGTVASENFKKATGQLFSEFMKNHNIVEAINVIEEYSKRSGKSIVDLFGSIQAGNAILNLTGSNLGKLKDSLDAVYKSSGTADEAMKKLDEGAERAFSKLKEQANHAVREIGEALIPQVKELTDKLSKVDWKTVFSQENINKIVKTGKMIGTVTLAVYGLSTALSVASKGLEVIAFIASKPALLGALIGMGAGKLFETTAEYVNQDYWEKKKKEREKEFEYNKNNSNSGYLQNWSKSDSEKYELLENKVDSYKKKIFKTKEEISQAMGELSSLGAKDYHLKFFENLKNKLPETIISSGTIDTANIDGVKNLLKEYQDFSNKTPKFWDLIGLNEKDRLEEKVSFFKSALEKAVGLGAKSLIPKLKFEFDKAENELKLKINKIDFEKAKNELEKSLNELNGNGITNLGKKGIDRDIAEYDTISHFLNSVKEGSTELEKLTLEELKNRKDELAEKIKLNNKEKETQLKLLESYEQTTLSLNIMIGSLSQLATVTGSKRIGGLSSILQGGLSLGKTFLNLKGGADTLGSLASIAKAGSWFSTAGIAGLGSIVGGVAAGVGIVKTIGSFFGKSGKKRAAEIDNRNAENQDMYKKQVEVMQALTQALMQNSERIKTFSDRMLADISKNPTLKNILGGHQNFTTIYDAMIQGKHFNDIVALEKGSASYRSGWRRKRKSKDTYTKVNVSEGALLKYLGFDKTELDAFTDSEMRQLQGVLKNTSHSDLVRATGRNLTESNIEEWKKQINEFVNQLNLLDKEKKELFRGSTLESFIGVEYKAEKDLIAEYTEQFKQLGLEGEQYNKTIKEMAKNNQVLITTMQDVRANTIESLANGTGGFNTSMKGYFEKIYKNASSVAYDVAFSDMDRYFNDEFRRISEKLVEIKKTGKLDFSNLFAGFDFDKLKLAEANEIQAKKSLDVLKQQLLNSGIDLSIVNKILPQSDFNDRINDLKNSLSSAMSSGLEDHKFDSFTKSLGQSLYDSTKSSLVKAFSESSIYQSMIQKFINVEDFKTKLEKAGSFKEAFNLAEGILKKFGYEMESNGFGRFDAINKINKQENQLGNAYYQDKASNVEIKVTNNFYETVYGVDDLESRILKTVNVGIDTWIKKPKVSS